MNYCKNDGIDIKFHKLTVKGVASKVPCGILQPGLFKAIRTSERMRILFFLHLIKVEK